MSRFMFAAIPLLLVTSFASPRPQPDDPVGPAEKQPVNQLVQVRGQFVGIKATGKRHQSYIFEFRVNHQLKGPGQLPTPKEQLVRFELFEGHGGKDLLAKLGGVDPKALLRLEDVLRALPKTPRFELVLWLLPAIKEGGTREFDAELVLSPVMARD